MDPITNPFSPGAGAPPPELVGRDPIIEQSRILLGRLKRGRPEKSMLLTGLRGVGKTVLLNEISDMARAQGCRTLLVEAHENKALGPLLIPYLRRLLFDLDRVAGVSDKVKRGLSVLRSFIGALKVSAHDVTFGIDIDPEKGTADTGDIETDLPDLFVAIGEAAADRDSVVAILIDEIQYFHSRELGALIMAMHRVQQRRLPLALVAAGLPILPGLAGDSKSYAERLFCFPEIGPLAHEHADRALQEPAQVAGVRFDEDALEEIYRLTQGYPYFLQEWGYQSWNQASGSPITAKILREATPIVMNRLDHNFFRVRFDRLTPGEKTFLRAMAELGPPTCRPSDVAQMMGIPAASTLSPVRAKLIKKGMIYSPAYGEMAFTVPLFDEFMRRAMPEYEGCMVST